MSRKNNQRCLRCGNPTQEGSFWLHCHSCGFDWCPEGVWPCGYWSESSFNGRDTNEVIDVPEGCLLIAASEEL